MMMQRMIAIAGQPDQRDAILHRNKDSRRETGIS